MPQLLKRAEAGDQLEVVKGPKGEALFKLAGSDPAEYLLVDADTSPNWEVDGLSTAMVWTEDPVTNNDILKVIVAEGMVKVDDLPEGTKITIES